MEFIIGVILIMIFWIVGTAWCSFGIIMPLIVIRTALPLTRYLGAKGLMYVKGANKQSALTLCVWAVIDAVVIILLYMFGNIYVWGGFAIGSAIALVTGLKRTGPIDDNIDDFLKSYGAYIDNNRLDDVLEAIYCYTILKA